MSRTKRYVPHWARYPQPYELWWRSRGDTSPITGEDPRNRWERGYDKHKATSYIYLTNGTLHHLGWKEAVTGKSRREYKRLMAKSRRRQGKLDCLSLIETVEL